MARTGIPVPDRGLVLVALLALATGRSAAASDSPAWTVWIDGRAHHAAPPLEVMDEILVDAVALGPPLGLQVALTDDRVRVVDADRRVWSGRLGASTLHAGDEVLDLGWVRAGIGSWSVPASVLAELARCELRIDRRSRRIELLRTEVGDGPTIQVSAPDLDRAEGWQDFTLAKTSEELHEETRRSSMEAGPVAARLPLELPPAHERLRVVLAIGHVIGADWGLDASAYGAVGGLDVQLATFVTSGVDAFDLYSGRLRLADSARGWGVEAGDLFSEAWGYARGARFSWRAGNREPSIGIYLPGSRTGYDEPIVAYRDELRLGERITIGGEVASDGAWLARGRLRQGRVALYGYLRDTGSDAGSGRGTTFTLDLFKGLALQGSFNRLGVADRGTDWGTIALRIPLPARSDGSVEVTRTDSPWGRSLTQAASLTVPLGPLRVRTRYQVRQTSIETAGAADRTERSYQYRELQAAVTYAGGRRLRIDLQTATLWPDAGDPLTRGQVVASYELGHRSSFQVMGTLWDGGELGNYRLRWTQEVSEGLQVIAEYGDIPPYQPVIGRLTRSEGERLELKVRRTWDAATPPRGGRVRGIVREDSGRPVPDVAVRLGRYRAYSDARGEFTFANVPPGSYELHVDPLGAPAHMTPVGPSRSLALDGRSRETADLLLASLGGVQGHVYLDRDGDRRRGPGEGVSGVVLVLDEEATASAADGSFAFHNVAPGQHSFHLPTEYLPAGVMADGPTHLALGLPAGGSLASLEMRLVERRRPVVFQEVP